LCHGTEAWKLQQANQKHLGCFEMCCWRTLEISWTDHVKKEKVLHTVKEKKEYPTYNKKKEDHLVWSHTVQELLSRTHYLRKDRRNNRSEGKMRRKT
jgi:hypothetical protein